MKLYQTFRSVMKLYKNVGLTMRTHLKELLESCKINCPGINLSLMRQKQFLLYTERSGVVGIKQRCIQNCPLARPTYYHAVSYTHLDVYKRQLDILPLCYLSFPYSAGYRIYILLGSYIFISYLISKGLHYEYSTQYFSC